MMKAINVADVVISLNGRDAGKYFCVISTDDEYSMISDGKGRRLEKPKKKKNKHIKRDGNLSGNTADKLKGSDKVTNNELRRALAEYRETKGGVSKCQKTE